MKPECGENKKRWPHPKKQKETTKNLKTFIPVEDYVTSSVSASTPDVHFARNHIPSR